MDYLAWLQRLRGFVDRWRALLPPERQHQCYVRAEPPLTPDQLRELREDLDCRLPPSVAGFLSEASSNLLFECRCLLPDGREAYASGELFHYWFWSQGSRYEDQFVGALEGMPSARERARDHPEDMGWDHNPELSRDCEFWRHALPLTRAPDTDGMALWAPDLNQPEPPVIWLAHDAESYLLAPSFDVFLQQWEYLGYDWGTEYHDPRTGMMDVHCPNAVRRRQLLGLEG